MILISSGFNVHAEYHYLYTTSILHFKINISEFQHYSILQVSLKIQPTHTSVCSTVSEVGDDLELSELSEIKYDNLT